MKEILPITLKIILFIVTTVSLLFVLATKGHDLQRKYEPRSSLLHRNDIGTYQNVLLGDSVFCSFYVDSDAETIWNKFEEITDKKLFPGALNGAKTGDVVNAAKYVAKLLPDNANVFIDIIPGRLIGGTAKNNYDIQMKNLIKSELNFFDKYINYLDINYIDIASKVILNIKTDIDPREKYNRRWDVDGNFALKRYKGFSDNVEKNANAEYGFLEKINEIFKNEKVRVVFVLTPLNKKQIYAYSDKKEADRLYSRLVMLNKETINYLNKIDASYIDLFDSVPADCFADLLHTNSCGDEIIARNMATWLANN